METTLIKQSEILEKTGYSRQHLMMLRLGGKVSVGFQEPQRKYVYAQQPLLEEHIDWQYHRGKVFYTNIGLEKILKHKKEKHPNEQTPDA